MVNFDLKVGFSCNNNCIHCVVANSRSTENLTNKEIKSIINKRPQDDCILFTGGEPTIRDDFLDLAKYAKKRGHKVALQTNGTQFSNLNFTKKSSEYIDYILIAIHSSREKVHDKIVQSSGMYKKTVQGLKNIVKLKIEHSTQTVISKLNANHLKETYNFIQSISPDCIMHLTFPHPMGNAYLNKDKVVPRYFEIKKYIDEALKKYAHLLRTEAIPICYLYPYHDIVINTDEEMVRNENNGKEIIAKGVDYSKGKEIVEDYFWFILKSKRKAINCKRCIFNNRCAGVWKEYFEFYGDSIDLLPIYKLKK